MTPNASVTPRHRSALLWGVVGALFFLVLHQGYLLLDGAFLGVGPVAAVGVAVFAATAVASYYTAGHHEGFESDETARVEEPAAGQPGDEEPEAVDAETGEPDTAGSDEVTETDDPEDEWIWGG